VLGDAVNVASRLQGHAQGGQVLVSESTFAAVSGAVHAEALPAVQLRGRTGPVGVYLVTGLAAAAA
jgi:adenylate cyclase